MIAPFQGVAPEIEQGVFIAETAAVIGDVRIGPDSSVWFGAVVRGDAAPIRIGAGTNVQDNATLHTDEGRPLTVGNNVTIGHNAVVHCAAVGDNTLIGMGAVLLDGAVIGKNCVVGAGAVVRQNHRVPDGSLLVGVPAKIVRALSPEEAAEMARQSHYVPLAKEYLR